MTPTASSLQYVVLHHTGWGEEHFDLMFESEIGGDLTTWRSPVWPLSDQTPLVPLGEHRQAYLSFEGPVSGGRGEVRRVASGTFEWLMRGRLLSIIRLLEPLPQTWLIGTSPHGDSGIAISA